MKRLNIISHYKNTRKYRKYSALVRLIAFLAPGVFFFFVFLFFLVAFITKDLPSPSRLAKDTSSSTIFFDRNDKVLFELYKDKNRIPVKYEDLPKHLIQATVAIEDKNFFKHQGISQSGIIRAIISIISGKGLQGGSTITQQLIKNVLLGPERTLTRKIKEMILALEVERRYKKEEILQMYLNEAPYGGTFWGVASAARGYFGKEVKDLNLVESAFLAGLPQSPSIYSPFIGKKDLWKQRTMDVLRRMREDGYINRQEEKLAKEKLNNLKFNHEKLPIQAPHFVFYTRDILARQFGEKVLNEGIKIRTSLSLDIQKEIEEIVKEEIEKVKKLNVTNAAVVVLDNKNGEILAMVGSYDYNDSNYGKFNAALGLRQPGSTVKPITYALAFEKGYTPATVIMDVETVFAKGVAGEQEYIPRNYDGKFRGPVQIRFALGNSINIPAVKMLAIIGIKDFLEKAYQMGISQFEPSQKNLNRFGLSLTLGGGETTLLELTQAFSVFANGGAKKNFTPIQEVKNHQGKILYKKVRTLEKQVLSKEAAYLISHILSDNNARSEVFGPNSFLRIPGKTVAVKTGTTDDKRDNWAVGYTKDITVGVWVGNNDNSKMDPRIASGATGASPIFHRIMLKLLRKYQDGIPERPDNVEVITIDAFLGGLPKEGYPTRSEYFIKGTEPKTISNFYRKIKISKSNGKLANEIEIKLGNYEEKEFIVFEETDPFSIDGRNRWQEGIDKWVSQQNDPKYLPPKEISDINTDDILLSVINPKPNQKYPLGELEFSGKIITIKKPLMLKVFINDEERYKKESPETNFTFKINFSTAGFYQVKIEVENETGKKVSTLIPLTIDIDWNDAYLTPTTNLSPSPTLPN